MDFGLFPVEAVVRGVRQRRSGVTRTPEGQLLVWLYLPELGWAYVVEGEVSDIVMSSIGEP